jgi:UDP-GlcNAc:undecaprenyl-phosphate GlcNAc-1-phosphate transferase
LTLGTFFLAAAVAAVVTPGVRRLPYLVALPVPDRWHSRTTPVTGGIALFVALLVALQPALVGGRVNGAYLPVVLGAAAAFALGLWDDGRPMPAAVKFAGQFAIASAAAAAGVRPDWLPVAVAAPVAVLILVACMNSVNLLDNMDGLAAGATVVASLGLAVLASVGPGSSSPVVPAAVAGACCGFLPYNYRLRRPAWLFMGDSGSHMLGFMLGGLAVLATPGGAGGVAAAVLAPLLVLALPALDTALVMIVRFAEGRPLSQGGRDHTSHRLVYRGFGERGAVALLILVGALSSASAVVVVVVADPLMTALVGGVSLAALVAFGTRLATSTSTTGTTTVVPLRALPGPDDRSSDNAAVR